MTGALTIPNSVTSIGSNAFYQCSGFNGPLTISNSLNSIESETFGECSGFIGDLTIPNSVTSIGNSAFYNCSGFSGSLTIPNSVTSIGTYAFYNCSKLKGSLKLPNSLTTISNSSFSGCSGFDGTLLIPNTITSIGSWAFYNCSGLTGSLSIPNTVTSIGEYAFCQCSGFTGELNLPSGIAEIGKSTFSGCKGLTGTLVIPNSVISIGENAFSFCSSFTGSLTIPNSVTSIGDKAFQYCSGFNGSLTISESVTSIGKSAFYSCTGFTGTLTIPNSITTIEALTFYYCKSLTGSITIPNSVTSIGNSAFNSCSGVSKVISEIETPFSISSDVFVGISSKAQLQVPKGTKSSYESYTGWTEHFANIIESGAKFSLSITATGYGTVKYGSTTIKNQSKSFSLEYGTSATIYFTPDNGYKIGSVKLNYKDITSEIKNNQYTFKIEENVSLSVTFESIAGTQYGFSVNATGNGYAKYNGNITRNSANAYIVNAGASPHTSFFPDEGYRIAKVYENNEEVTSKVSNSGYTVYNISENTMISVWFEEKPITTYDLSMKAAGNGSITYESTTWKNDTKTFTVNEGAYVTITMTPENGYRIKSVTVDGKDVTADVNNNLYTTSGINKNTTIEVEFEAIPVTTYQLNIKATGNGDAIMGGYTIRQEDREFPVNEGTNVTIVFSPDNGNSIQSVKVNGADITEATGSRYVIEAMTANTSVEVTFVEDVNALTVEGINYQVTSQTSKNVKLMGGSIGQTLTVPATVTQNGTTWNVTEIEQNAVMNNSELAAIIWNPEVPFTATVSNPNLLLYVIAEQYAPEAIKNVVVNGVARQISLVDAASGNGFCCPQTFTAQSISYTHRYGMETGVGASKGWETIALPFDVQEITHQTKGTIVPFANWKEGDNTKPFWLYELTGSGFVEASSIQAYKPYIISMPNNPKYNEEWQLNGEVTFKASSVTIGKSDNLAATSFQDRTFIPNLTDKPANEGFFALNVINDYSSNNSGMPEGSRFVLNMRQIHPFEAYMSTTSKSRHAIGIFDDMTTDIKNIKLKEEEEEALLFDLQGRKTYVPRKGVYIKNGKKYIKK